MNIFKKLIEFVREAYFELRKVNWLSRKELIASTVVIVIFIILASFYVGLIDFVLARILSVFLSR